MKTQNFALIVFAFFLVMATFATSNGQVFAQSPCVAQVSYPAISSYYNPNIEMTVPVSATCSYSGQLFAAGDAYDTTTNTDLGSINTGLSSTGSGNFNGQLNFFLPTTIQGHTIQISVSIYNTAFGNNGSSPLATTSQTVTIDGGGYNQNYQNSYSSCQPGYSYVGGNCYPPNYNNGSYYNNGPNYNNGYCSPSSSYVGSCYPPSYSSNYNNYNNYYAYCPLGYSYIGGSCSYPGYYYYSMYRSNGNYYYHWYYRHRHW
ncbi:MAG TPA: hypothetical protein VE862_05785 [Candidatus Acidoferrum sp.]|nr:hypothetical protein [Candidatus Acidoferrum sp.]